MKIGNLKILTILLLAMLVACSRSPQTTADIPRLLPPSYRIAVAPFTQPLHPGQLISGHIPEAQGKIPDDTLNSLDLELREALMGGTKRQYDFIKRQTIRQDWTEAHNTGQPGGLKFWLEYGRAHDAQFILVPQILDWHERVGSEAGVTDSAHVRAEFYLISIKNGSVMARSIFEEKQVGLIDNLLGTADFFRRGGKWVTATALAREGMQKAVRELGL